MSAADSGESLFSSYLSRLQMEKIARRPEGSTDPSWERRPGAILFVDAAGFTELTNRFAEKGDVGVEELSRLINAYFGRLTDIVIDRGGDVIGFGGDSAMVVWPVDSADELADAARAAGRSALAVQEELRTYEHGPGESLGLRASIGAGSLTLVELGGVEGRWHFLVAGEPILQVVEADARASSGEIVLSPAAWDLLRDDCEGTPIDGGGATLRSVPGPVPPRVVPAPIDASVAARLRPYVPRIVADRLAAGQESWLGEFRNVSVMFVKLAGARVEDTDGMLRLHRSVETVQRILHRHDGEINNLMVDDKGTILIGVLGLPPRAHPDDAARCVRSALEVREEMAATGTEVSVGVSSGLSFCGVYGTDRRRQYTVLGPVMHRAARLMEGSRGSLFCDEASARAASSDPALRFDHLPPIRVKGERAPIPVYSAGRVSTRERAPARPRRRMVGRLRERAALSHALATLLDQRAGGVTALSGEEAIGKTALVEELLAEAREAGALCLVGTGTEIERNTPYAPWRAVLKALLDPDRTEDRSSLGDRIAECLETEPELAELAPLLGAILPLQLPDNPLTASMRGEVRAENTRRLVAGLVHRLVEGRPAVLVIEDAQWADSASWTLILQVAREVPSILTILTHRPMSDPPEAYDRLREVPGFRSIELGRLSREEAGRLLGDRLGVGTVPDPVLEFVHERAGGHPFFTEELAYVLRDSGRLTALDGMPADLPATVQWERIEGALRETRIPDTIRGVVQRRLDRLTQEQQLALRVASVVGARFALPLLTDVHPVESDPDGMRRTLDSLVALDLLELESTEPHPRYAFRQSIIREVAYHSMLFEQRRSLHRKVAEWYEQREEGAPSQRWALLGHHWKHAGEPGRAREFLARAGERALREYANLEAVRHLTEAIELVPPADGDPERDAHWHLRLARAYVNLSRYEEALPHFEAGLSPFGERLPRSELAALPRLVGQVAVQGLHRLWPDRFLGRKSEQREEILLRLAAYEGLVETHYVRGRQLSTLAAAIRALNVAETAGPSAELARNYASTGVILGFVPLRGAAEAYARRARETARRVEDPATDVWVSLNRGVYDVGVGRWDEASELLERVRSISERLGDRRRWEDATQHLAGLAYLRGDFRGALELARRLYDSAAGPRGPSSDHGPSGGSEVHPVRQLAALRLQLSCLLRLGSFQAVPERLEELRFLAGEPAGRTLELMRLMLLALDAQWNLRRGRYDEARASAEKAIPEMSSVPAVSYEPLVELWAVAETLLTAMEEPSAGPVSSEDVRRVVKRLASCTRIFPVGRPAMEICRGLHAWRTGRSARATESLRKGLRAAEDLGMPYFEALAHFHIARHREADDSEREVELDRAYGIFERLGASYDLELVRRESAGRVPTAGSPSGTELR